MPIYRIKAQNKRTGERVERDFDNYSSESAARADLDRKGYQVITIEQKQEGGLQSFFNNFMDRFRSVDEQAITIFSRQFATMINAGLPMVKCLDILMSQAEDAALGNALTKVKASVEGGNTLSNSLKQHPRVFDNLYTSMVSAGELGGVLDEVLDRLATFKEKDYALKKQVKSALTYPVVILGMAVLIVLFLVYYILPTFVGLFEEMGLALPLPTRVLISITKLMQNFWGVTAVVGVLVALIFAFNAWKNTEAGARMWDSFLISVPVFGPLIKKVSISRFCRTLGTLLSSGVSIMQALDIVSGTAGNKVLEETIMKVRDSIKEGESIADPLGNSQIFPPMVVQMVSVGEETGNLDAMLGKIADFYDTEVEYMLASLTSMLEPFMIVGMGGIVGFIVLSVFLPLYQLIGNLG